MDVNFLERYLKDHPDSIMFARLADAYLGMKRVDEAIQLCEAGIKKHPYYATGHFVLAKSYMANSLFEQAEKEFKRVLLFDPKYLGAHKLYGDLMREIGWENTYQMSYKKIMQFDPLEDSAKEVLNESGEKTEEHESTKDLSEFSLASSENVESPPKSLDEQEQDWSQGSDWSEQSDWPQEPKKTEESAEKKDTGWADESTWEDVPEQDDRKEQGEAEDESFDALKDEPVFSPEPESAFESETDSFEEDKEQDTANNDIDIDAISPMPVTEDEEELVFGEEVSLEDESKPESGREDASIKPEQDSESEKVTEVDEDELGEKEAEEYSYILEDIFKDEVGEDKSARQNAQEQVSKEDAKSALDREADSFMKSFQDLEKPPDDKTDAEASQEKDEEDDDFPDFSKPQPQNFEFSQPKQPEFTPPPHKQEPSGELSRDDDIESEDEPAKSSASEKKKSDKIVTPTLGEIYAAQGQYAKAIDVFEGLLKKHPDNESYSHKIQVLKKKLEEAGDA